MQSSTLETGRSQARLLVAGDEGIVESRHAVAAADVDHIRARIMTMSICCRAFPLSAWWRDLAEDLERLRNGEPCRLQDAWFIQHLEPIGWHNCNPIDCHGEGQDEHGAHEYFRCTLLGDDGRCSIYDHRPKMCRKYTECEHMDTCSNDLCKKQLSHVGEMEKEG
jgi:Fe-S-cluster containining protein